MKKNKKGSKKDFLSGFMNIVSEYDTSKYICQNGMIKSIEE